MSKECFGMLVNTVATVIAIVWVFWDNVSKIRKNRKKGTEELHRTASMGKGIVNVLGIIYTPTLFVLFDKSNLALWEMTICIGVILAVIISVLYRIYKCECRIRLLDKQKK